MFNVNYGLVAHCSLVMIEFTLTSLFEVVLLLIVIFVAFLFFQGSTMESIWGETIESCVDHPTPNSNPETTGDTNKQDLKTTSERLDVETSSAENFGLSDNSNNQNKENAGLNLNNQSIDEVTVNLPDHLECDISSLERGESIEKLLENNESVEEIPVNYIVSVPKCIKLSSDNENIGSSSVCLFPSDIMATSRYYEVNGSSFVETERQTQHDDDTLAEYELYRVDKITEDDDDEDLSSPLEMHTQLVPQGVLVNGNVVLWDAEWHTMARVDARLFRCAVCQLYCDRSMCEDHTKSASHLQNLDSCKPLRRFDLSIVRKINSTLHCGVCNEIFDIKDYKVHENSKTHEDNLLKAINKVSDLMYDSNLHPQHSGDRQFHISDRQTDKYTYVTEQNRNMSSDGRNVSNNERHMDNNSRNTGEYHFDANTLNNLNNNNISVYEDYSENAEDMEETEDDDDESEEEDEEIEEYTPPCQGISYASMASKPSIELPKFLKIDLGTKEVRVKFESWHMILKLGSNEYYCIVCRAREHVQLRARHCVSCAHLERLARCTLVRAFQDYLIRKVDDKLYHCGHCNNLQCQDQMEEHILTTHPKKNRNYVETTPSHTTTAKKTSKPFIQPKKTESDKSVIVKKEMEYNEPKSEPKVEPKFDVFGDIILSPFGDVMKVPALNFNLIMKRESEYYCAVCDRVCADVAVHVEEQEHVELMTMAPFIKPFRNHLTRAVRGMLHCSLCNDLFPVSQVNEHNLGQPHCTALANAFGMKKAQVPDHISRKVYKPTTSTNNQHLTQAGTTLNNNQPLHLFINAPDISQVKRDHQSVSTPTLSPMPDEVTKKTTSNTGQNLNYQNSAQEFQDLLKATQDSGTSAQKTPQNEKMPSDGQNMPSTGHNLPNNGQNMPNTGHNLPITGQSMPYTTHNQPITGQNVPNPGQNLPNTGQNIPFHMPNMNIQAMKSIPPTFPLPPTNPAFNQQFMGAPLIYSNFNAPRPRPTVHPFPSLSPNNTPNLLSPNISTKNLNYNPNIEMERKTLIITDKSDNTNGTKSGNNNSTCGTDNFKSDMDNSRCNSVHSNSGMHNSRRNSVNSNSGIDNSRHNSVHSRSGMDNSRSNSDNSKTGMDNSRRNSNNSKCDMKETDSLSEEEDKEFDEEEMVFVKFKNTHFKITNSSYNTFVFLDNGLRYCFACGYTVRTRELARHARSTRHARALAAAAYLDKYAAQLFRQVYVLYHCGVCNEVMSRTEARAHVQWPPHAAAATAAIAAGKNTRRSEGRGGGGGGAGAARAATQRECIYRDVAEPACRVRAAYTITSHAAHTDVADSNKSSEEMKVKKKKLVILNNVVMKIPFHNWHSITEDESLCMLCQADLEPDQMWCHVGSEQHAESLRTALDAAHYPALIRKINEWSVNCVTCNVEVPGDERGARAHVQAREHCARAARIVRDTARSHSYADCCEDHLVL